jgi:hypothetical protein
MHVRMKKIKKIMKNLRQGVNISLKRQVRPNIFNVNMLTCVLFFKRIYKRTYKNMLTWKVGEVARGVMLAHGLITIKSVLEYNLI